jgi:hypothetical protein
LPTICQWVTKRGRASTLRGDRLERFAVWSGYAGCALSVSARCSLSVSVRCSLRHR